MSKDMQAIMDAMDKEAMDLCEEIDAAVFSGDTFLDHHNLEGLIAYMGRWQRWIDQEKAEPIDNIDNPPTIPFSDVLGLVKSRGVEGLCFLGAGGEVKDWVDGVTMDLQKAGIMPETLEFTEGYFREFSEGRRDLILIFPKVLDEGPGLDIGRLAMWRLRWNGECSWLSDYIVNYRS